MTAPLWSSTAVSSAAGISNLAHLDWCNIFESNIPLGVSTQGQKQVLLQGYPGVEWAEGEQPAPEPDVVAGGGKSRRARKYPRWVVINGQRFRVWNAEEERQLLQAMAERAEVAAKTAEVLGDKPLAKEALRRKVRIEKRIATVDDREQEWLRRLMDEDEEILILLG